MLVKNTQVYKTVKDNMMKKALFSEQQNDVSFETSHNEKYNYHIKIPTKREAIPNYIHT